MKKQSDMEKRLKILRSQLYSSGKIRSNQIDQKISEPVNQPAAETLTHRYTDSPTNRSTDTPSSDLTYLGQDLFKILTLSTLALGVQVALYFSLKGNLIKLPF